MKNCLSESTPCSYHAIYPQKIDKEEVRRELEFGTDEFNKARKNWKFTVGMNGIPGAPLFYGNRVLLDGAENWGFEEWVSFIQEYKI